MYILFLSCSIGFVFQFCLVFIVLTWFLHVFHLFLGVVFPFWARFLDEKKWKIRCHVIEVFGSIIICSLAPTLIVLLSRYNITQFPAVFALPSRELVFFTYIVPNSILMGTGVCLIFLTFYYVHKVHLSVH